MYQKMVTDFPSDVSFSLTAVSHPVTFFIAVNSNMP